MKDLTTLEKCGMLSKQECSLLKTLREIKYGRHDWVIFMEKVQPGRIEKRTGAKSIKL